MNDSFHQAAPLAAEGSQGEGSALATVAPSAGWRLVPLEPTPEMLKAVNANWRPHPSAPDGWSTRLTKMYQMMLAAAPRLAAAAPSADGSGWIPVTERLPVRTCECLAYYPPHRIADLGVTTDEYRANTGRFHYSSGDLQPTHWMPLPAPPRHVALTPGATTVSPSRQEAEPNEQDPASGV